MSYPCWPLPFLRDLDKFRATNGRECFHEYSKKSAEITTTFQNKNDKKKLLIVHTYVVRYIKIRQNREQQKKNRQTSESERLFFAYVFTYLCVVILHNKFLLDVGKMPLFSLSHSLILLLNSSFFFLGFFLVGASTEKIRRANKFYEKNSVQCAYFNVKRF